MSGENEPQDFAAFEAAANAGNEPEPTPEPEKQEQPPEEGKEPADPPEPEEGKEPEPKEAEPEAADDKRETRNRRWEARVDSLTARLRAAEQRALEAEKKVGIEPKEEKQDGPPDPGRYEFGEADGEYIRDLARYETLQVVAEERKKATEKEQRDGFTRQLNDSMTAIDTKGREKYPDFEEKLTEAAADRAEPMHPVVAVGVAVSPVGADVVYRLATDDKASARLDKLAKSNPVAAAMALGELEGEYLDADSDDDDLDPGDPMDMARMNGRLRARMRGQGAKKHPDFKPTDAPEPPANRVRGTGGRFETSGDTTDFAAFERMANKG